MQCAVPPLGLDSSKTLFKEGPICMQETRTKSEETIKATVIKLDMDSDIFFFGFQIRNGSVDLANR